MARLSLVWAVIVSTPFFTHHGDVSALYAHPVTLSSTYHILDKRPLNTVNDRFLSYTLAPEALLGVADCREANESSRLIRTLLPAYLRIAGPDSKRLRFQNREDFTANSTRDRFVITGEQWLEFVDFVKQLAGLQIVVSLNGNLEHSNSDLDLTNALEFITYSSKSDLNLDWELGYEFQKMSAHDGRALGREVTKLRKVLDVFPRYRKSSILGPDITSLENRADVAFVQGYLSEAGDSLNAITLHYDFSTLQEDDDIYEKLSPIFNRMDTYMWIKEGVLKPFAKGVVDRKSIWLSESETKDRFSTFSDAISFVHRLGAAAKLGASVYLRKPHLLSLSHPTSEYWAAVLFKSLVGKTVLDAKYVDGNNTKVYAFGHCARVQQRPDDSIINSNVAYKAGAVTLYGVNTGRDWSRFFFRMNSRYEQIVHAYILTTDDDSNNGRTLFNHQELRLSEENELPVVFPRIREYVKYVMLPPRSIFFLVLPYANSRACVTSVNADESLDVATKSSSTVSDANGTDGARLVGILEEEEVDDGAVYVSYAKRQAESSPLTSSSAKVEPRMNTRIITISDDTWLSALPDQLVDIYSRRPARMTDDTAAPSSSKRDRRITKIDNYRVITQALLGKRNVSFNSEQTPQAPTRQRRDTESGNHSIQTMTLPPFQPDLDAEYTEQFTRGHESPSPRPQRSTPTFHQLRKNKSADGLVLPRPGHKTTLAPNTSSPSASETVQPVLPSVREAHKSDMASSEPVSETTTTTMMVEPETTTAAHQPSTTELSMDEPSDRGRRATEQVHVPPTTPAAVKPLRKLKRPSRGRHFTSTEPPTTTTTPAPTKRGRRTRGRSITKPTSPPPPPSPITTPATPKHGRRKSKHVTTSQPAGYATRKRSVKPNYDSTNTQPLPRMIEETHAKLKRIVDANRARAHALHDEHAQRKSQHRAKRQIEVVEDESEARAARRESCQPMGRSAATDAFDKALDVCKDLGADTSESVRERIRSLNDWIRGKYEEIRKELVSSRSRQDIVMVRKQIHDYSARIQKELGNIQERLRTLSAKPANRRKFAQPSTLTTPAESSTLPAHQYHHHPHTVTTKESMERVAPPAEDATTPEEGIVGDPLASSRSVRSVESNEIASENDDEDERIPGFDHYANNKVDTKLREVTSRFDMRITMPDDPWAWATKKSESFTEKPRGSATDGDICDRRPNILIYFWCRWRDFLSIFSRVFNDNSN